MTWAISVPILDLCSRVRPDVRDRQIDRRQTDIRRQTKASLNAPPVRGGGIIMLASEVTKSMHTRTYTERMIIVLTKSDATA